MSVTKPRPLMCAQMYLHIIRDYTNQNVFSSKLDMKLQLYARSVGSYSAVTSHHQKIYTKHQDSAYVPFLPALTSLFKHPKATPECPTKPNQHNNALTPRLTHKYIRVYVCVCIWRLKTLVKGQVFPRECGSNQYARTRSSEYNSKRHSLSDLQVKHLRMQTPRQPKLVCQTRASRQCTGKLYY